MIRLVAIAGIALLGMVGLARGAVAQSPVDVASNQAQSAFPNGITFTVEASTTGGFDDVRLIYQIAPDGVRATSEPACTGTTSIRCVDEISGSRSNAIIPGAEVTYFWRFTVAGETHETEPLEVTYEDNRFEWKTITEGNMTLWYYGGDDEGARAVLEAAYESQQRSSALLQATVDYPVKVFLYETAEEMQPAILSDNDEGVITRGEVVYSDTAMVAADSSPEEIARHEIAHIVQRAALSGPYDAPDWVIEGMAVYMQSEPLRGQRDAIESAIQRNDVFSVRTMSSATSGALSGNVFLFYGESWSLVRFLIETYGEEKFAQYFQEIEAGAGDAGALEAVYGFNQDGLENAWRESVGLPPRDVPTPENQGLPTTEGNPITSPQDTSDDDNNTMLVVGIIGVAVLFAALLLGLGISLARRLA